MKYLQLNKIVIFETQSRTRISSVTISLDLHYNWSQTYLSVRVQSVNRSLWLLTYHMANFIFLHNFPVSSVARAGSSRSIENHDFLKSLISISWERGCWYQCYENSSLGGLPWFRKGSLTPYPCMLKRKMFEVANREETFKADTSTKYSFSGNV